jgi:hypothetical protein
MALARAKRKSGTARLHAAPLAPDPWPRGGFLRHYAKHPAGKDRECWNHILGIAAGQASEDQYLERAVRAWRQGWLGFRAEMVDQEAFRPSLDPRVPYHPEAEYAIDHSLLTVAVDPKLRQIRTCFHEHFDRGHSFNENVSGNGKTKGNYLTQVGHRLASKRIRNLQDIVLHLPKSTSDVLAREIEVLHALAKEGNS